MAEKKFVTYLSAPIAETSELLKETQKHYEAADEMVKGGACILFDPWEMETSSEEQKRVKRTIEADKLLAERFYKALPQKIRDEIEERYRQIMNGKITLREGINKWLARE